MSNENTMLLITSNWDQAKTFKLMPIDNNCPFSEGVFDPSTKTLVLFSKGTKQGLHMVPARDENGDVAMTKQPRNPSGKRFKEKQITLETFTEFYITEKQEITDIIKMFAKNADTFDYATYMTPSEIIVPETPKIEIIQP